MSKALKVVSISSFGNEGMIAHPIWDTMPEDTAIVAILSGVIMAGSTIKSFEIVEA
jgi:hypothetical protein